MDILIDLCRLCQTKPGITPINADFAEKIYKVTRININNNRHLPTNVCTECKTQIMAICDYIDKVNRVDHQLRNILNIQKNNLCNQTLDNTNEIDESTNKYKCPICLKLYNNEKCFRLHMKNHSELKCSDCNIYFEDLTKKTDHNCTSKLNVDLFECEICQKKFKAKNNLRVHIKTHKLDYNCTKNECNKVFTSSYSLRIHTMYDHDGNQRYLCVSCGKKFNTKNSLNCHEKIHSDVKEYSCKLCNLNFSVRSNLRAHEKKHHEGVRFYCSKCSKTFITKCSLDRHEKTHIGIKEFACNLCPSAFYTSKELNKHKRYHAGIRQHKCDHCYKAFFEKHHLIVHLRSHTGERPYECKVAGCGKSFMDSQKLKRHNFARHSNKTII